MLGKSVEVDILRHLVERNMRDLRAVGQDKVDTCALRLRDARFELLGDLLLGHPAVVGIAHHHVGINFMAGRRPRAKAQVRHHEHTRDNADDLAGLSRCFTWNARRLFRGAPLAAFAAFSGCIRRLPPFLLFFSSKAPFISSMLAPPVSSDLPDREFPASRFSIPQFVRKRITIW